jgi:hypothetical protein
MASRIPALPRDSHVQSHAAVHKNKLCDSHARLEARAIAGGSTRTRSCRPPPTASGTPTSLAAAELKAAGRNMCHGSASASAVLITVQYSP